MGHAARWNELWVERRPVPLNLNERQALVWLSEYGDEASSHLQTPNRPAGWTVKCSGIKTTAPTLHEAICQAAAKYAEENDISAEQMERNL
jgi:hypothetical protein